MQAENLNVADVALARQQLDSWRGDGEVLDQSLEKLTRVLEANFENYLAQFQQTRLDAAAESLKRAEAFGTHDPWLDLNWGDVLEAQGEYSAAEERWRRVLQSNTANTKARSHANGFLLESYKRSGNQEGAVSIYEAMIRLDPSDAWLRGDFAQHLSESGGRHDEAIEQARAALKVMDYGVGRRILAMALYRKWADAVESGGNGAEQYFLEAQEIYPDLDAVMAYGGSVPGGELLTKALITRKRVSIDATADDGATALLIATNRNRNEIVKKLLELKADPNLADRREWTPLLSAADEGNTEIVHLLLEHGADIHATLQGTDAAAFAERKGYLELSMFLRETAAKAK